MTFLEKHNPPGTTPLDKFKRAYLSISKTVKEGEDPSNWNPVPSEE